MDHASFNRTALEWRVLGDILNRGVVHDGVTDQCFASHETRIQFSRIRSCLDKHGAIDVAIFADYLVYELGEHKETASVLAEALAQEGDIPESLVNTYVNLLRSSAARGEFNSILERYQKASGDVDVLRSTLISELRSQRPVAHGKAVTAQDAMAGLLEKMDRLHIDGLDSGIPSGMSSIDTYTGGFQKTDLVIVGARPATGKTAMMLNWALAASRAGKRVLIVSAEQPAEQLAQRVVSMLSGVSVSMMRNPRVLSEAQWSDVTKASADFAALPITIIDMPVANLADIQSEVDVHSESTDIVFVDYLQRIKTGKSEIYDRVSEAVQTMKELARTHELPMVVLCQIGRGGAGKPTMEHLKGSGDIEQEADQIYLIEREPGARAGILTLDKNRHGPAFDIAIEYDAPRMRFIDHGTGGNT